MATSSQHKFRNRFAVSEQLLPSIREKSILVSAISIGVPLALFCRVSILPILLDDSFARIPIYAYIGFLGLGASLCALRSTSIWIPTILLLACTAPSVILSRKILVSGEAWIVWCAVLACAGPLGIGRFPEGIRRNMWLVTRMISWCVSIFSAIWFLASAPNLGRGHFTGVMSHSMLLGPISAIGCIFATHLFVQTKQSKWLLLVLSCAFPCLLAGSRIAVAAMLISISAMVWSQIYRTRYTIAFVLMLLFFAGAVSLLNIKSIAQSVQDIPFLMTLAHKQIQEEEMGVSTRDQLWLDRRKEFTENPIVGVGFGIDDRIARVRDVERIDVEPGSGFLFIASSTGICGMIGFAIFAFAFRERLNSGLKLGAKISQDDSLPIVVFFLLHSIAEGWIFSGGSLLCLLFWLSTGRLFDVCRERPVAERKPR